MKNHGSQMVVWDYKQKKRQKIKDLDSCFRRNDVLFIQCTEFMLISLVFAQSVKIGVKEV